MNEDTIVKRQYTVHGMTCDHCVMSVCEEVSEVEGVTGIDIDLASGLMDVSGADLRDDAIVAAVTAAGYTADA